MDRRRATLLFNLSAAMDWVRNALLDCWRVLTAAELKVYRPEAYYMRGPGPKWRQKHARDPDAHLPR